MDNHKDILLAEGINILQNKPPNVNDSSISLQRKLAQWQCQYNISQAACGGLLKILGDVDLIEEMKNLPKDRRTLLKTPKKNYDLICVTWRILSLWFTTKIT